MAKRKNSDRILMYSIGGIFLLIVGLGIALIISSNIDDANQPVELEYTEFQHLTDFATIDDQSQDVYAVYYYQLGCGGCDLIKQEILTLAQSNNSNLKIYLMDARDTVGTNDHIVYNGEDLSHTPTMLVYRDGELADLLEGGTAIEPFINDVESGNYNN